MVIVKLHLIKDEVNLTIIYLFQHNEGIMVENVIDVKDKNCVNMTMKVENLKIIWFVRIIKLIVFHVDMCPITCDNSNKVKKKKSNKVE